MIYAPCSSEPEFEYFYSLELTHRAGERRIVKTELDKERSQEELKNGRGESEESAGDVW